MMMLKRRSGFGERLKRMLLRGGQGESELKRKGKLWEGLETLEPRLMMDSTVVFNELMYHALDAAPGVEGNQWVELHNQTLVRQDLSNWRLSGGIDYTFPVGTTIEPGGYLVVSTDPAELETSAGISGVLGPIDGGLSNGGERINLRSNSDRLMDSIDYGDNDPWAIAADGSGTTLAKINPQRGSADAGNWTHAPQMGGTPGAANFVVENLVPTTREVIGTFADWKYEDSNADLGTAWRELGYDDSGWDTGNALFFADAPAAEPGIGGGSADGLISIVPITNAADSGIDASKNYTHTLDFGGGSAALINGVQFTGVTSGSVEGIGNVDWTVSSGTRNTFGAQNINFVNADILQLYNDFVYNGQNVPGGTSELTLSGLIPGEQYETRIYVRRFGVSNDAPPSGRSSAVMFDTNGDDVAEDSITINEDNPTIDPPGLGSHDDVYALSYSFTADSGEVSITFDQFNTNQSWHIYGLSNELLSGNNVISFEPITNDQDSGISINNVYTHALDFGVGDAGANINGVQFTQVTAGNVDGLSGIDYTVDSGTRNDFGVNATTAVSGDVLALYQDFMFNGANAAGGMATLTLNDLEVGEEYKTRLYVRSFGIQEVEFPNGRSSIVGFDTDGDMNPEDVLNLNQDNAAASVPGLDAPERAYALTYVFTADSTSLTIDFTQMNVNQSWHVYGLSNEVVGETNEDLESVPALQSSGLSGSGGLQGVGEAAEGWTNALTDEPLLVMLNHPAWLPNDSTSQWIGVVDNGTTNVPPGEYRFKKTFDLAGWDPNTVSAQLRIAVDDTLTDVLLNGASLGISTAGFGGLTGPFNVSGFTGGVNTLEFVVQNGGAAANPNGLRVEIESLGLRNLPEGVERIGSFMSSGIDENGNVQAVGAFADSWTHVETGEPLLVMLNNPAWLANDVNSQWVGTVDNGVTGIPEGNYTFRKTFDLAGWDETTAIVNMQLAVDNSVTDVLLNGVSLGITAAGFSALSGLVEINSGFVAGENTLDFVVNNAGPGDNPGGLNARLSAFAEPKPLQTEVDFGANTHYFRKSFMWEGDLGAELELDLEHFVDDGAVFYLNGVEIHRHNMPGGAVDFATNASSDVEPDDFSSTIVLPGNALVVGENVLAVEVHQSGVDDDVRFGARVSITETPLPADQLPAVIFNETAADSDAAFFIELKNDGDSSVTLTDYIVRHSDGLGDYVIPAVTLAPGEYLTIDASELGYTPVDGERLFLLTPSGGQVLDGALIDNELRGRSALYDGRWLWADVATPGEDNSFAFEHDLVINEIMYHDRGMPPQGAVTNTELLVSGDAVWSYDESGNDLGTAWKDVVYPAGDSWLSGQGALGFETAVLSEPIRTTLTDPSTNDPFIQTYYFRTSFEFDGDLGNGDLFVNPIVDDGVILYLNGVEIYRENMPAGAVNYQTSALATVEPATYSGLIPIDESLLVAGTNVLAAELHQRGVGSTDFVFGAQLAIVETIQEATEFEESDEEWIELFNRGTEAIDVTGWEIDGGIEYEFEPGTMIAPGEYVVIAKDPVSLQEEFPGIRILGEYDGSLGNGGELIELIDAFKNPADEVHYYDGGRWDGTADAGGSSLELRNPYADNGSPEAWAPSLEADKAEWQTITYRGTANPLPGTNDPAVWNEFLFHLLDEGEFLIDDISVIEDPDGAAVQMIQNGVFNNLTAWRTLGTHGFVELVDDPDNPGNSVLMVSATGAGEHVHNHIETTFANGQTIVNGQEYEISFRARWVSGSNQLNSRLYFNRLARTTLLDMPRDNGTPGAANSRFESNIGPTYEDFIHGPATPVAGQDVTVSVTANDPDGVNSMVLWYSVNGEAFASTVMSSSDGVHFAGVIPGQNAGDLVQFYVEGEDGLGATSTFPAAGEDSRAMFMVDDGRAAGDTLTEFRILLHPEDAAALRRTTNAMTNHRYGATVIYGDQDIYYHASVRLKGSPFGRPGNGAGFNLRFDPMHLFRDVQDGVALDKKGQAGGPGVSQREMVLKHMGTSAGGGIAGMYDDVINIMLPNYEGMFSDLGIDTTNVASWSALNGPSQMLMARYSDVFLDAQYEDGGDGKLFEYELIYYSTKTVDGNVESLKLPPGFFDSGFPVNEVDLADKGDNVEAYRWYFLTKNMRQNDDYTGIIDMNMAFSLTGNAFAETIDTVIDVDQWTRTLAFQALNGIGDTFNGGLNHNMQFFVNPEDGRVLLFPWDWDFTFTQSTNYSLYGATEGSIGKIIAEPEYRRLWDGHLLDLVNTVFNTSYITDWVNFFETVGSRNDTQFILNYIANRSNYVLSQLPTQIPFEITTNGGADFSVNALTETITGTGWIDVREVRLAGSDEALPLTFVDGENWELVVPLGFGDNVFELEAYNHQGELVGSDTITITSTLSDRPLQDFLRVSEVHYHPIDPTQAEIDAGFDDANDFEFIELTNIGDDPLDLTGAVFVDGIEFDFASGLVTTLQPGAYVVLTNNMAAFEAHYGASVANGGQILVGGEYDGQLSNGGEQLVLMAPQDQVILDFTYEDGWYPITDGAGPSLSVVDLGIDVAGYSDAANWQVSDMAEGTPGRAEPSQVALPGDATYDGLVNLEDLAKLATNFGLDSNANPELDVRWLHGDFTGDGIVNLSDLARLATFFGQHGSNGFDTGGGGVSEGELTVAAIDTEVDLLDEYGRDGTSNGGEALIVNTASRLSGEATASWDHIRDLLDDEDEDGLV